ncbi:hypothetical protein FHR99_002935 [Litorivivens lipolytica]|uniref:histidine kinase n=1 Tax=Litorivivens lipolytica TaxID=1524264 RepID=A0A7W4Z872_9GAMM|nr:hybrid sensor histidine kinase/response regulator [Litorivivens lipolytica]MBB3048661.1 hypothetical protein [Litorivivens lipolytica]
MKILLVDDDRGDRATLKRALGKTTLNADVEEASALGEALNAIRFGAPDAVLLDYQMPGVEELEGLEQMRRVEPFLPIVLITGYGDELLAARAIHAGADEYLPKHQIDPPILEHVITNAMDKAAFRQKLDENRRELEQFAHILSHDLRAPLNQINNFCDMLRLELNGGDKKDIETYIDFIVRAAGDANALVRLLTDFLRADSIELTFEPVALQAMLEELRDMLTSQINVAPDIIQIDVESLPEINSNPLLLRQILQNLLGNALKYNESDTPRIEVTAEQGDDGIGIEERHRELIFEPFTRLHGKGEYSGSGLGLAIAFKNANRLNGGLTCEDNAEGGSRFVLTLPRRNA